MIDNKKIVGILGMERDLPIINNGNGEQLQQNMHIRKNIIDKLNSLDNCVVFEMCPTGNFSKEDQQSLELTNNAKWAIMQQVRMCDEVVLQEEFGENKYSNFVKVACKYLKIPIKLAKLSGELIEMENTAASKIDIHTEFERLPVVGVVAKNEPDFDIETGKTLASSTYTSVRKGMVRAFNDCGATTIGITMNDYSNPVDFYIGDNWREKTPTKQQQEKLIKQIELCDVVVLQGGVESESYECWVAEYCHKNNIPCIGICAGRNCLVRALDGKTTRMLAGKTDEQKELIAKKHYSASDGVTDAHKAFVVKNSLLSNILDENNEISVNSWHFRCVTEQDISDTALVVEAYDDENNVEVCCDPTKTMFRGIQFHPELIYKQNTAAKKIIDNIIKVAQISAKEKEIKLEEQSEYDTAAALMYRKLFGPKYDSIKITKTFTKS